MLRITVQDLADRLRLQLEGRLSGAWVPELEDCWRTSAPILKDRELWVDLTGVDCVDAAGKYLLALMHKSGVRFIASGCMMAALVQEITGNWPVEPWPKSRRSQTL
jgi:anti-anti-sigma regulatory factor